MNLRISSILLVGLSQVNLADAGPFSKFFDTLTTTIDKIVETVTNGNIDIKPNKNETDVGGVTGIPKGGLGAVCNLVVDQLGGILSSQVPPDYQNLVDTVVCGCEVNGLAGVTVGCTIPDKQCFKYQGEDICGIPIYEGVYTDGGLTKPASLESTACIDFPDEPTFSNLCVNAVSGDGLQNFATIKECTIFAVRKDNTIAKCTECKVCAGGQSVSYNCANLDIDESPTGTFFVPPLDTPGECVGAGLVFRDDLGKDNGAYIPFMAPV